MICGMAKPDTVAEIKVGMEACLGRKLKIKGMRTPTPSLAGTYWPPQFVIMDGHTKPRKIVSTRGMTVDTQAYHPEPRVAAIVSSHFKSGIFRQRERRNRDGHSVDHRDLKNQDQMIEAAPFLHDGGFESTHRYFMDAANASEQNCRH